jgi:hypothetical protein
MLSTDYPAVVVVLVEVLAAVEVAAAAVEYLAGLKE